LFGSRLMGGLLYDVVSFDPLALGGAVLVLGLCATLASIIPAGSAASIEPIQALRMEYRKPERRTIRAGRRALSGYRYSCLPQRAFDRAFMSATPSLFRQVSPAYGRAFTDAEELGRPVPQVPALDLSFSEPRS
jgi:hypothetical protein